ncbi:MAG TPA: type II secretion system protein [Candidatus Didemnitutus sp.]|nr:type II secretion system protein [Candidatus Didemnitutus sp.]
MSRRAFTILELLVAVAITVVMAGMVLSVTTGTVALWRRTQSRLEATAQARLALDFIERDIQAAILRRDAGAWLASDILGGSPDIVAHGWFTAGTIKPSGTESQRLVPADAPARIEQARFGMSGCWLRLFTTKIDDNSTDRTLSAPSVVSYQIERKRVGTDNTEARYRLYRSEVRQEATSGGRPGSFQSGIDLTAGNYATASGTPGDTGTVITPASGDVLADNVVDFGVWFYVRNSGGTLQRVYPANATDFTYRSPNAGVIPEAADVVLRILSREGVTELNALEMGRLTRPASYANDAEWWWGVVEAHSSVFVRRIEVKGAAQ